MTKRLYGGVFIILSCTAYPLFAQDNIELETTRIKGNTELPKYMYVVPWQDKERINRDEQKLVLHNLYGDLFDPVMPAYVAPLPPPPPEDDFPLPEIPTN